MVNLHQLGLKHSTDKGIVHHYLLVYEKYLYLLREDIHDVLEVGVDLGRSLRMWRDYFPNASIVGMDINPECKAQDGARIWVAIGDSTKADEVERELGGQMFDLIVDDGSHIPKDQLMTLCWLWPHLRLGGLYFIEDIDQSPGCRTLLDWADLLRPAELIKTEGPPDSALLIFQKGECS
jgi:23S rRNA U2552 (ribose-2'-O)-methylase RlmE/FtsJ